LSHQDLLPGLAPAVSQAGLLARCQPPVVGGVEGAEGVAVGGVVVAVVVVVGGSLVLHGFRE
jgi:hypothetical protein